VNTTSPPPPAPAAASRAPSCTGSCMARSYWRQPLKQPLEIGPGPQRPPSCTQVLRSSITSREKRFSLREVRHPGAEKVALLRGGALAISARCAPAPPGSGWPSRAGPDCKQEGHLDPLKRGGQGRVIDSTKAPVAPCVNAPPRPGGCDVALFRLTGLLGRRQALEALTLQFRLGHGLGGALSSRCGRLPKRRRSCNCLMRSSRLLTS
jgi:hypothetical protein